MYRIYVLGSNKYLEGVYEYYEEAALICKELHLIIEGKLKIKLDTRIFEVLKDESLKRIS